MTQGATHGERCASFDRAPSADREDRIKSCCDQLAAWTAGLKLSEGNARFVEDRRNLHRFSVARRGNIDGARKQLEKCLAWRDEHLPLPGVLPRCERCEEERNTHCFFSLGPDKEGRNVVYANSARALCNEAVGCVMHMSRTLEIAFAKPEVAQQWVWIVDFNGFTMKQALQIKTSIAVMQTFSDIMPERLGMMVFVNPPMVLRILLEACKPFVDDRTMSKIVRVHIKPGTTDFSSIDAVKTLTLDQLAWLSKALTYMATPGNLPTVKELNVDSFNFAPGAPTED